MSDIILKVTDLKKHFQTGGFFNKKTLFALDGVSFSLEKGKILGLVGESGCGKSTLGRTIIRLYEPTSGEIIFQDKNITKMKQKELRPIRKNIQMIFQDPYSSLNPKMTIEAILSEPFQVHENYKKAELTQKVQELLATVGLDQDALRKFPHEFSGGQRQRIGIARAIALQPSLVIADEPVSALDVSVRAQIVNLLMDLKSKFDLSMLFISHDLTIVEHISDHIAVMYLGKIVELTSNEKIYKTPKHPYTKGLLSAILEPVVKKVEKVKKPKTLIKGDIPSPFNPPSGCAFHPRCPIAKEICSKESPVLSEKGENHLVACHFAS